MVNGKLLLDRLYHLRKNSLVFDNVIKSHMCDCLNKERTGAAGHLSPLVLHNNLCVRRCCRLETTLTLLRFTESEINAVLKSSSTDRLVCLQRCHHFVNLFCTPLLALSSSSCLPNLVFHKHSGFAIVRPKKREKKRKVSFQC